MIIAVDAAGGDYAPLEIIKGAVEAAIEFDLRIVLIGNQEEISTQLRQERPTGNITIANATQDITCNEHPVQAVRNKPDSSIVKGVRMLKERSADAFVSAGNTGAMLASSFLLLDKIKGIERPAICVTIPVGAAQPFLLLDAGANSDCQPRFLVQFAYLGKAFAHSYLGIESPRVGLLNNGTEEAKGSSLTREAYSLLKKTGLNFVGNIEGQDILKGKMDVLVTDGFTGNVLLKTLEGFGDFVRNLMIFGKGEHTTPGNRQNQLRDLIKRLDFSEYGGSCLLGLKGNVIICHGRSKASAIKNAIRFASQTSGSAISETIVREMEIGTSAGQGGC